MDGFRGLLREIGPGEPIEGVAKEFSRSSAKKTGKDRGSG